MRVVRTSDGGHEDGGSRGPWGGNPPAWTRAGCPGCGGTLDLSQPDPRRAHRLLGVCADCGGWSILEVDHENGRATVTAVPDRPDRN